MSDELIPLWIGLCAVGGLCAYNWYWYIKSIIFYRENGFDFSKDFGPELYLGGILAPPKAKFYFAMPFVLVVTSFLSIIIALTLMGIVKVCYDCGP
ncbi:hypothetical protein AMC83_PE00277 (plasmid) [Rhizobium phaseoli]|uniref:hypothetical protein n=1 Tax=Rhizobium phaseoli TaxID=396 RepID=UPI0007EA6416|nr:hypothetical protein [Rhizobium phaseoli]ANL75690.1 hypothetical protein AMC83_PE00277 [Rhizobium phaseoli]